MDAANYSAYSGYAHLGAGLTVGMSSLAAGLAIGIVGDAGVRANAQQPRLFVGMILILIFAEALVRPDRGPGGCLHRRRQGQGTVLAIQHLDKMLHAGRVGAGRDLAHSLVLSFRDCRVTRSFCRRLSIWTGADELPNRINC
ncbi:unnamed protein product [Polarella glacialis]|uniref:V-ATPase proteolipid subunit C-like domain-containing protein n=1 Tax=Polarella glacialis TaxID=89957 RepID=A0A813E8X7_POLGL|nr:unnamed protein product [Polarella glacialis]